MLIITTAVIIALVIVSVMMRQRPDHSQLSEPRASMPVVGIQIVCGNCAGDDLRPKRTYLDRSGNCSQCGGHSYLLASNVYRHSNARQDVETVDRVMVNARVLAFDSARVNKVAV